MHMLKHGFIIMMKFRGTFRNPLAEIVLTEYGRDEIGSAVVPIQLMDTADVF